MKYYVTRYALTDGIKQVDGEITKFGWLNCKYGDIGFDRSFERKDFSLLREDAVLRAEEMRCRKIKSLKKQIEKLEALKF